MRRSRMFPLVLFGAMLLLSLLGVVTGVVSFLLLRAGYGPLVWGLVPPLVLLLIALIFGAVLWWLAGGPMPGGGPRAAGEKPREGSSRESRDDV